MSTAKQSVVDEIVAALLSAEIKDAEAHDLRVRARSVVTFADGLYVTTDRRHALRVKRNHYHQLAVEEVESTDEPPDNRLPGSV
jgi:hypothetical protein